MSLLQGLRGLRKAPSFAAVAILLLALGLGAITAMFRSSVPWSVGADPIGGPLLLLAGAAPPLVVAALLASIPQARRQARRAAAIDPMQALRSE